MPSKRHLNRIEDLGQAIGLERNEIRAAVDYPLDGAMTGASSKSSFLDRIVYRIICMVILFAILVVVLYSAAQPTYGFATRYGSISPNDFK